MNIIRTIDGRKFTVKENWEDFIELIENAKSKDPLLPTPFIVVTRTDLKPNNNDYEFFININHIVAFI
jgi:hypothetical protein